MHYAGFQQRVNHVSLLPNGTRHNPILWHFFGPKKLHRNSAESAQHYKMKYRTSKHLLKAEERVEFYSIPFRFKKR